MLIDIFLSIIAYAINIFAFVLPDWSLPVSITDSIAYFLSALNILDGIFPIPTVYSALLLILAFQIVFFSTKIASKIINFMRGSGQL